MRIPCWHCSRALVGSGEVVVIDGLPRHVHKACAKNLMVEESEARTQEMTEEEITEWWRKMDEAGKKFKPVTASKERQ